ncbi:hypothetical protein H8356DRAFT_1337658 [Neocallimastix lanati (nom. inval.)]|nr:hypothetical protein H8356DRAFT_1337658 [Neocallimastix sp. JGI-2020a]
MNSNNKYSNISDKPSHSEKESCIDTECIENAIIDKSGSNKDKSSTSKVNNSTPNNTYNNFVMDNSFLMDDASANSKSIKRKFSSTEESN